ncbi:MAG: hypothetical protein RIS64_4431 [Bacteroidota bacterium]|jgi:hypothetical protein
MNHLFNFNVFGRWLKLSVLSFWLCLPLLLFGQTDFIMDLNPVVSTDLGMSEVTFATNSLNELATDEYVYVVIHGKGSTFGTFSNASSKWNALKTPDVATWIAANVPPTKTIILLSSANQTEPFNWSKNWLH